MSLPDIINTPNHNESKTNHHLDNIEPIIPPSLSPTQFTKWSLRDNPEIIQTFKAPLLNNIPPSALDYAFFIRIERKCAMEENIHARITIQSLVICEAPRYQELYRRIGNYTYPCQCNTTLPHNTIRPFFKTTVLMQRQDTINEYPDITQIPFFMYQQ
jgi:hypothetical protein